MSEKLTRRALLLGGLAAVAVVGTPFKAAAEVVYPTFEFDEFGAFPTFVTDNNMAQFLGAKVSGYRLDSRQHRNQALEGPKVPSFDRPYSISQVPGLSIEKIEKTEYGTAFKLTIDRYEYLLYQNDNVNEQNNRCDAVMFPLKKCHANGSIQYPSAERISAATEKAKQFCSLTTGTKFEITSYNNPKSLTCDVPSQSRDRDRDGGKTSGDIGNGPGPGGTSSLN